MVGQANRNGHLYYRHAARTACVRQGTKAWVRSSHLEDVIMKHLFECFGNPAGFERAIEEATPNLEKVKRLREQQLRLTESLTKVKAE